MRETGAKNESPGADAQNKTPSNESPPKKHHTRSGSPPCSFSPDTCRGEAGHRSGPLSARGGARGGALTRAAIGGPGPFSVTP